MTQLVASIAATVLIGAASVSWSADQSDDQKFPGKGKVTIVTGPVELLIHYLNGKGEPVEVKLRDLDYDKPDLRLSFALKALANRPCGAGDTVKIESHAISAKATGKDAAGIGGFSWIVSGDYSSDGNRWWFKGGVVPKDGPYNFDKKKWGKRGWWDEVATRLGSTFPGTEFDVYMSGSLKISIDGFCNLDSAGNGIV